MADLLFMTCFCCEILGETHSVTMHDIAREGTEKLVRRHPHVFGDPQEHDISESQERWNEIKNQEKRARGIDPRPVRGRSPRTELCEEALFEPDVLDRRILEAALARLADIEVGAKISADAIRGEVANVRSRADDAIQDR